MNQAACSRSHPVLNATARSMVAPCAEHLQFRDSLGASFEDIGAPALANGVCDDTKEIADRFSGELRKICDAIVRILSMHAAELGDTAHSKNLVLQPSDT